MKNPFIYIILLGLLYTNSFAAHYYIEFTDKGKTDSYQPSDFLSAKSIQRRLKSHITIDYSDYPVNSNYIHSVAPYIKQLKHISKWMNGIVVETDDYQLINIRKFSFVKNIQEIDGTLSPLLNNQTHIQSEIGFCIETPPLPQIDQLNLPLLHQNGYTGKGILICVMDDGFNTVDQMNAFKHLYINQQIVATKNFETLLPDVYHVGGHGTAVLSQIAGLVDNRLRGSGPDAQFLLAKTENEKESPIEMYQWLAAAEWADSIGADIFSTSLGYTQFDNPLYNYYYADMDGKTTIISLAATMAARKGILVINSAGNEGNNSWRYISAPADADSILTVGAIDINKQIANFSSRGPTWDGRIKPDVVTMGYNNTVAYINDDIFPSSGTSFSCPIMSGMAASIWQSNPSLSSFELRDIIKSSADRAQNPNNDYGWGIPDGAKCIKQITGQTLYFPASCSQLGYSNMIVTPNPATITDEISISIWEKGTGKTYSLLIYSSDGKLISENLIQSSSGLNRYPLLIPETLKGLYYVKILINNEIVHTQKLIRL